ncbi:unnamed protein product [Leptidea sinapis]|uniref:Ral GTPase-activating protein subunit alpha/beta N-terminal domain-containing protein n=1 Tax=Leptidea sinapis TaxID=189913 RepID=A0A5E4QC53_9NEOP|nr:unnamed protein product [Leptidea sinapis]
MSTHYYCVELTETDFKMILPMNKIKWKCPTCKGKKNTSAPTSISPKGGIISSSVLNVDTETLTRYIDTKLASFRQQLREDISSAVLEVSKALRYDINKLEQRMDSWDERLSQLERDHSFHSNEALGSDIKQENNALRTDLHLLTTKFDELDQASRSCNVEIQNIPERKGENLIQLSLEISLVLSSNKISSCENHENSNENNHLINSFTFGDMFTKKSHQDVKKSSIKIQDSKKDSTTRLKHLKIVLEHFDIDEAKNYFEANFSHVYFILYDNFILAENNLRQKVHKAGREELEGALCLLEKVLSLLPEYFLLWFQALGDNAPPEVNRMFASLVPGLPESSLPPAGSPFKPKVFDVVTNISQDTSDFKVDDLMQHPNFTSVADTKKVVVEHTSTGIATTVSSSIFHDTNALNPVQSVDIQPLLPPSASEKLVENETKYFFEILLDAMATSITKVHWKDRSHAKSMRSFAFLLEKFKIYYLPVICPQFNYKNSLYKPNLGSEGQPSSMTSTGSHMAHSNTPTPATSLHHEEETSFTVGHPSDSSRASSHDSASNTPHPSLESGTGIYEEVSPEQVVRDVLCCSSREHVDFTVTEIPPFLLESTHEAGAGEPQVPPRRLRNDSYLGALGRDNVMVRAGLQNVLQVFMTQAANVFVSCSPAVSANAQLLLDEQTDTCKRVLNIYRYMVMHVAMDGRSEQLLVVLLQITSIVLTKVPPKKKQDTLGGFLAPALFQTLIVTWIKANLNVAVKPELWQSFMELLTRLTHWEDLIKEWAKTMETLTRKSSRVNPDAQARKETSRRALARCRSDPHLDRHSRTPANIPTHNSTEEKVPSENKPRRWYSLDSIRQSSQHEERDSASGSRSPSPAPSSGVESSSIKDSPLQIDLASDGGNVETEGGENAEGEARGAGGVGGVGVVLGGRARGWLPDVAWVLWRRMLASLGDPNALSDPQAHQHFFNYLIHLNATLMKMKNKVIAKVVSDAVLVLADYTDRIVEISNSVKPLAGSLLLCLAEFAVRCGPALLLKDQPNTPLLIIFKVLYAVMNGTNGSDIEGLTLPEDEDFDPNIQLDNLGPKSTPASNIDVKLWAQTICSQLVVHLGHWPLWPGCQLSSGVCEQHDSVPPLGSDLGAAVLSAPHVQLMRISDTTLASFVELPALDQPHAGTTPENYKKKQFF